MLQVRGALDPALAGEVSGLETLAQVAQRWPIASVVAQDEFTHDVVASLPDGRALAFGAT
ncbi:MAG TPA: hypothetical protein VH083_07910 [Myxococcales bacterium]|jgi:hypothetical protein|nr:hypothetical protein [Myxococcales bacterium]